MPVGEDKSAGALGFLTVVESAPLGLIGGYLLVNLGGRPLEFHCTAPVRANRAQRILYGPTLEPYLHGELIGQTLVNKASTRPLAICVDLPSALAVREHVALPVLLITSNLEQPGATALRIDAGGIAPLPALARFRLGQREVAIAAIHGNDREQIVARLSGWEEGFDLAEPFDRIREAIEEAQRGKTV